MGLDWPCQRGLVCHKEAVELLGHDGIHKDRELPKRSETASHGMQGVAAWSRRDQEKLYKLTNSRRCSI